MSHEVTGPLLPSPPLSLFALTRCSLFFPFCFYFFSSLLPSLFSLSLLIGRPSFGNVLFSLSSNQAVAYAIQSL